MKALSLKRLGTVMTKEIRENWRTLLMQTGIMLGVLILAAILIEYQVFQHEHIRLDRDDAIYGERAVFTALFFVFGTIAASLMFSNMKSKESRISTLMYPATQLEKYLSRWIIYVPGFIIVFFIFAFVADFARYLIFLPFLGDRPIILHPVSLSDLREMFPSDTEELEILTGVFLVLQSFFVLGSSIWPRNSFIKTSIALFVLGTLYTLVITWIFQLLFMDSEVNVRTGAFDGEFYKGKLLFIQWSFVTVVCVANYVISYFRFKENEIINRW